jgi:hypothetical protein
MPLSLSPEEQGHLLELASPLPNNRRPEFWSAVVTRLEAAGPAAVGPGSLHRVAREVIGGLWTPPPDLRQGRLGGRGPRGGGAHGE